ncbi:high mobility group box domain-containing protein [Cladochytrium replicatum]|nr:high mobility group box domain-containing protein [Cladochytrium replicatum]
MSDAEEEPPTKRRRASDSNDTRSESATGSSSVQKRGYKRHPKKDPNAPVRPHSAYVAFQHRMRKKLKEDGCSLKFDEVSKIVGDKWRNMPEVEKNILEQQAAIDKADYDRRKKIYRQSEQYKVSVA